MQLCRVARGAGLPVCGLGDRLVEASAHARIGDRDQPHMLLRGVRDEFVQQRGVDRAGAHQPTLGAPFGDRGGQSGEPGIGWAGDRADVGDVGAVLVIGEAVHRRGDTARGERDTHVVQRGAAADEQVAPVGVGGGQVAAGVGVQRDGAEPEPPAPRLGVVHRWCAQRLLDRAGEHGRGDHRCLPGVIGG
ncbi:hypothetical protein WEH80_18745 [Actinomycetes bacterium KLBMP 9759]